MRRTPSRDPVSTAAKSPIPILEFSTMADRANFDTTSHQMVQAIVTVLAVITPVVCGSIFLTLTANLQSRQKWQAAVHVALSILVILVASAFVGLPVLGVFGISRVPHRRWAHHRVYGVRHAGRRAQGGASAAVLGDGRRCPQFAGTTHHVCRWSGHDYGCGDAGGCPHAGRFTAVCTCGLGDRRRGDVRRLAACQSTRITHNP